MLINCDVLIGYLLIDIGGSSVFIGSAYVAGLLIVIFDKVSNRLANIGLTFFLQTDLDKNSTQVLFAFARLIILPLVSIRKTKEKILYRRSLIGFWVPTV